MWWRNGLVLVGASWLASTVSAGDETLCAIAPGTYSAAKTSNPEMAFAIAELEQHAVATWYSDRNGDYAGTAKEIVASCPSSSRMSIVVYGLPNKDCDAGESMVGSTNLNSAMYQTFVTNLQATVGDRKVLYIVEPDAIALLAKGGCAKQYGYGDNLAIAVKTLSSNPNADIYLDVGHWMLSSSSDLSSVATIVRSLVALGGGRVKGISINTSNYRSSSELSSLCASFRGATSDLNLHCIIDTSRNFNGPSSQDEWCNFKNAAVGRVPTGNTGDANMDYYVWIKPPGESDGTCAGRTTDAMAGPGAGLFFPAFMKQMWNNGALVKELGMPVIDGTIHAVQSSTTAPPTTTPSPTPTPESSTLTPAPTNSTQQSTTTTEDRSIDDSVLASEASAASLASSTASSSATAGESSDVAAEVVASPIQEEAVIADAPAATTSSSSSSSAAGVQEATTRSSSGGSVSAGIVVLGCLIGVAMVALAAVITVRIRQRSIEETKTPVDPRMHYLSNSPSVVAVL